jgi:hypothetical protein
MPRLSLSPRATPTTTNTNTNMTTTDKKLTATEAREFTKRILAETIFTKVKAKKGWDGWEINIDGGRAACYGRTIQYVESAEDIIRIFAND